MGSGCNNTSAGSRCAVPVSSKCVEYQGEPVPLLGICTGDTITEVESVIIQKLLAVLSGTGITLSSINLNNCVYLKDRFGQKDKTLANLIQLLIDSECNLKSLIDSLNTQLGQVDFTFDLKCLPAITNPTKDKVIQQLITSFCDLKGIIDNMLSDSNNNDLVDSRINIALNALITSSGGKGITKTVNPDGLPHYNITGFVMPYSLFLYGGPLNVFDGSGLGITGTYAEGCAIANGKNGTPDFRGFVGVGATKGVQGDALDALVDPVANSDASMDYSLYSKGGLATVKLLANQNGLHSHTISDTGHVHSFSLYQYTLRVQGGGGTVTSVSPTGYTTQTTQTKNTEKATTGIVINNSGAGAAHENRMPYKSAVWVMRLNNQ